MKIPENEDAAFTEALDYLYSFINFELRPQDRYMTAKLDEERPSRLMAVIGDPHLDYPAIHIAGTKGKGSVAVMCAACLRAAGYTVGLYTSPHLQDFRERIRILTPADNDGRIPHKKFVSLLNELKPAIAATAGITWFEILTAVAFLHFAREGIDVAVLEVGLGGRLDATNVVTPLAAVITSLSIDHTKFLGDTLSQIAYEKGGIIKPSVPIVTANQKPEALHTLQEIALAREAPLSVIGQQWQYTAGAKQQPIGEQVLSILRSPDQAFVADGTTFDLTLSGSFQLENATLALAALQVVRPHFPRLDETAVHEGLAHVRWEGRLQLLHQGAQGPTILVDCAHNPDSAKKLSQALAEDYIYDRLWLIYGSARDKDTQAIFAHLLPMAQAAIMTTVDHPRSATPAELVQLADGYAVTATAAPDMATAVTTAWRQAGNNDLICVTGSIYIVGDLLNRWERLQSQLIKERSAEVQEKRWV